MKTLARNLALLTVITWLLSGCAGSPPVHYYTLSVEAETGLPSSVTDRTTLTLAVDPISLPDVVDRPQIVLQSGSNQVTLVDDHRWAESLKSEIPRIIAGNLSQLLLTKMVWAYPQHVKGPVDYRGRSLSEHSAIRIDPWIVRGHRCLMDHSTVIRRWS
ncbi:MAG: PqiC family protein [Nitrospirales bacterium]|nr:PqiC family protein [Nitrospirales bacterium]